jgi:hypothetical protein
VLQFDRADADRLEEFRNRGDGHRFLEIA